MNSAPSGEVHVRSSLERRTTSVHGCPPDILSREEDDSKKVSEEVQKKKKKKKEEKKILTNRHLGRQVSAFVAEERSAKC
jgi:hypothetical protein